VLIDLTLLTYNKALIDVLLKSLKAWIICIKLVISIAISGISTCSKVDITAIMSLTLSPDVIKALACSRASP
jgi:hypothetical protein